MSQLTESKEQLSSKLREASEKLVELEHERELAGGQFIPSDRDYYYSNSTSNSAENSISEAVEEARQEERAKLNGLLETIAERLLKIRFSKI